MFDVPLTFKIVFIIIVLGLTIYMMRDDIKGLVKKANETLEDEDDTGNT